MRQEWKQHALGEEENNMRKIIEVPYIDQSVSYPTGCESVSATMLLQYLGYEITVDEFIQNYVPCVPMQERDGQMYGPDPRKAFCGSPYDKDSFGCYAPVIREALQKAVGDQYTVVDETGTSMQELIRRYIDRDMPVVFWACIDMKKEIIGPQWKLLDSGALFTWRSNEHCMLLVGYDEEGYYFNDPHENHGLIRYPKTLVEERHRAQYEMACSMRGCL